MVTTLILLKLLVRFGIIKPGNFFHPDNFLIQLKRIGTWIKSYQLKHAFQVK
jgi:hypothetical protein